MTEDLILSNARVVTADEIVAGTVRVRDGVIEDVSAGPTAAAGAVDLDGDYLLPGFVELHTDNMEKHFSPRPGVSWPAVPAALAHDAQIAAAGITTVFDALAVGDVHKNSSRVQELSRMADALQQARDAGMLRAEHLLHLRCEVSHANVIEIFEQYVDDAKVRLVSLMDHTPGQRQFTRMEKYKEYYQGKYGFSDEALAQFIEEKLEAQKRYSAPHREILVRESHARGITLASHDDATTEHVEEAVDNGVSVSEFPTTIAAAKKAHGAGLSVLMGAPNLVLGGSHSGNVSAMELAREDVLDILSSDYVPSSMVIGLFRLWREGAKATLPEAVATVSRTPARVAGLDDRGEIAAGKRADLVRVTDRGDAPVVTGVWREGSRII